MISNLDTHHFKVSLLTDSTWADSDDSSPVDLLLRLQDDSTFGNFLAFWLLDDDPVKKWSDFLECEAHI